MALLTLALVLLGLGWNFGLISGTALIVDSTPLATRARTQGAVDVLIALAGAGGGAASGIVVGASTCHAVARRWLPASLVPAVAWAPRDRPAVPVRPWEHFDLGAGSGAIVQGYLVEGGRHAARTQTTCLCRTSAPCACATRPPGTRTGTRRGDHLRSTPGWRCWTRPTRPGTAGRPRIRARATRWLLGSNFGLIFGARVAWSVRGSPMSAGVRSKPAAVRRGCDQPLLPRHRSDPTPIEETVMAWPARRSRARSAAWASPTSPEKTCVGPRRAPDHRRSGAVVADAARLRGDASHRHRTRGHGSCSLANRP